MSRAHTLVGVAAVAVLLALAPAATAHSWQTTVSDGPMELGVSSSPERPVAGLETIFSGRISDSEPEGDAGRSSSGAVVNTSIEVHIRGPDGYHDHAGVEIAADDPHFGWTYMFPTNGTYEFSVHLDAEGTTYEMDFIRDVSLLPADAKGEQLAQLSRDVEALSQQLDRIEQESAGSDDRKGVPGFSLSLGLVTVATVLGYLVGRRQGG